MRGLALLLPPAYFQIIWPAVKDRLHNSVAA